MCEPLAERFTVVGNALAQHDELSLTAIGLATHIQSLPDGTPVGIKALAAKFPEGETRIASALLQLEAHGYLARIKERLPSGQIVTRTISYNVPRGSQRPHTPTPTPTPGLELAPALEEPEPAPHATPADPPPSAAADLLTGLRALSPRLLLAQRDVRRLVPAVTVWLERGVAPADVQQALASGLPPEPLRHPAAFLTHRLTALLPPPTPTAPARPRPSPLQTCDACDRAFRSPEPGCCRDCCSADARVA